MKKITVFLAAYLFTSMQVAAEIYKCTDAGGKVHYGDKPCKGESIIFTPRAGPRTDENAEDRVEKRNRLLRAYQEEHVQNRKKAAEQKAEKEKRMKNCHRAMNRYQQVTSSGRIYQIDGDGNRIDFTDEERANATASARADIKKWCD